MYNKLYSKILDSSIWLEPDATRLVWLTILASMDEDGFAQFASVRNLAHRARVSDEDAAKAVETLESPDGDSSDPDEDGRRIERVPGGWMVLNAAKYRAVARREDQRAKTRERVRRHRERMKRTCNADVTPSETEAEELNPPLCSPDGEHVPPRSGGGGSKGSAKKGQKLCPESWQPSEKLLERIEVEGVSEKLAEAGTSVALELERMRNHTFATARADWDRTAWNWLLTECKRINEREARNATRR